MNAEQLGNLGWLAQSYAAYYNSLCEHGMPPEMAIVLTRDFQRMWFDYIFHPPPKVDTNRDGTELQHEQS